MIQKISPVTFVRRASSNHPRVATYGNLKIASFGKLNRLSEVFKNESNTKYVVFLINFELFRPIIFDFSRDPANPYATFVYKGRPYFALSKDDFSRIFSRLIMDARQEEAKHE